MQNYTEHREALPRNPRTREVTSVVAEIAERGGVRLSDEDMRLVQSRPRALTASHEPRLEEISEAGLRGFFDAAASGDAFVPLSQIQERFGRTLEENYPEAGAAFLRFAATYWSLKMIVDDVESEPTWAHQLLLHIERIIGPLFFPFPGPLSIDPARRESDQREILREFGETIDVEEFIRHNPILIRDRASRKGGGCLGIVAVVPGILILLALLMLWLSR